MSRSPVDDMDLENRLESPTVTTGVVSLFVSHPTEAHVLHIPVQNSTTRWLTRPNSPNFSNLPNFWTENKPNLDRTPLTSSLINFLFSLEAFIAPKYGDTSATYWKLYGSEAEIYDENLVESFKRNTSSMGFLVSGDAHRRLQAHVAVAYDCLAEHFVLFHRRIIYHRNIQDAST